MDYFLDNMKKTSDYWTKIYNQMNEELKGLPKGTLIKHVSGGREYLYHQYSENGKQKFRCLGEHEQDIVRGLLKRAYITEVCPAIKSNLRNLNHNINSFKQCNPEKTWNKIKQGKYRNLQLESCVGYKLSSAYGGNLPHVLKWMEEDYKHMEKYTQDLKHITNGGTMVRSKSELNIATLFEINGIAYKYELPFYIEGVPYYIDFSFFRPSDMKLMRWEHFGRTNDAEYLDDIEYKLAIYRQNGITLWDNLIISFDSPDGALDGRALQGLFNHFVLS